MKPDIKDFLKYEIANSWWAGFISWEWAQRLSGTYFANKTARKYRKYIAMKMKAGTQN